ncbi:hypothetical protein LguiA_019072 [Lonicera macranthoides]
MQARRSAEKVKKMKNMDFRFEKLEFEPIILKISQLSTPLFLELFSALLVLKMD